MTCRSQARCFGQPCREGRDHKPGATAQAPAPRPPATSTLVQPHQQHVLQPVGGHGLTEGGQGVQAHFWPATAQRGLQLIVHIHQPPRPHRPPTCGERPPWHQGRTPRYCSPQGPRKAAGMGRGAAEEAVMHSWHCSSRDPAHSSPPGDRPSRSRTHHQQRLGSASCHLGW